MTAVVGRDRELTEITSFLELAEGEPRILLLEGDAGIGKTTLWRAGVDAGRELGYRVLACVGSESETQLSFTAVRDLVAEAFGGVADDLPPPQRHAMEVVLLHAEATGVPPAPDTEMKRTFVLILALTFAGAFAVASQADSAERGALHVTKECSQYNGQANSFCTIVDSNLPEIGAGSKVVYLQPAGPAGLDTDVRLDAASGTAFGHVTLSFKTSIGTVIFTNGTDSLQGFQARSASGSTNRPASGTGTARTASAARTDHRSGLARRGACSRAPLPFRRRR